jgi:MFS family permease
MYFGTRPMYIVFSTFILLGQFVFTIGCQNNSMYAMLIGRVIFGLGGECLNICQNAMIVKWFFKSELALPLGLTISFSRLGSVVNDNLSPRLVSEVI